MNSNIAEKIKTVQERMHAACIQSGRAPAEVKLLLATKTVTADRIKEALLAGHTLIAENKVQELKDKYDALSAVPHTNHFIGHLQTNKIKDLVHCEVSCLQSLDRFALAEKLQQQLETNNRSMEVLVQVNTSGEASKFGIEPDKAIELVRQVTALDRLKVRGLMTIGLFSADTEKVRQCFRLLKSLQEQILAENLPGVLMQELSMGMSGDLETAIAEGATIIRVGTAIFGQRQYPDRYYWNERSNDA
ncbi:MAG: YggS family pyridoxal phosphate-dependent enzyme [Sphingobacteriales bacterium]|nr:MAG: YggS family pyridoxal phosphate-dependent enzyme [Sphingobacteriales bacterium]